MFFDRVRAALAIASVLALAACNTANTHIGDEDPFVGEAVKYDMAIQTINPQPVYPANGAQPGSSGAKGQAAIKRYRSDAVKQVEASQTASGSAGGGSTSH
jgi:hypothetical protein